MNWKLIFQLSLLGLFMAVATVYFIPLMVEPVCWIAIFLFCAYTIARSTTSRFLHGLFLGLANCVWVTGAHIILASQYLARHAQEAAALKTSPLHAHPRLMMLIMGSVIGVGSGCIIGLLALAAGKFVKGADDSKVMSQTA